MTKQLHFHAPKEIVEKFQTITEKEDRSQSYLLRNIVTQFVQNYENNNVSTPLSVQR